MPIHLVESYAANRPERIDDLCERAPRNDAERRSGMD
jgi:hypothetical protein